ncbi:hypothetical protein DFH09DRAFT_1503271 [Mycena vulgaris]|nr:hypothetical protein DFH09DRAFT_1503271 [Mycena vulgaris]
MRGIVVHLQTPAQPTYSNSSLSAKSPCLPVPPTAAPFTPPAASSAQSASPRNFFVRSASVFSARRNVRQGASDGRRGRWLARRRRRRGVPGDEGVVFAPLVDVGVLVRDGGQGTRDESKRGRGEKWSREGKGGRSEEQCGRPRSRGGRDRTVREGEGRGDVDDNGGDVMGSVSEKDGGRADGMGSTGRGRQDGAGTWKTEYGAWATIVRRYSGEGIGGRGSAGKGTAGSARTEEVESGGRAHAGRWDAEEGMPASDDEEARGTWGGESGEGREAGGEGEASNEPSKTQKRPKDGGRGQR